MEFRAARPSSITPASFAIKLCCAASFTLPTENGIDPRGKKITGLETFYSDLDELTSGFQPSDLLIIAARPSMGKTAFAINIAENAAVEGQKKVAVFSLEMSREALLLRLLCSRAKVDSHKMRTGSLWRDDMQKVVRAMEQLAETAFNVRRTAALADSLTQRALLSLAVSARRKER